MRIRLYVDEIKKIKNVEGQFWMYIGVLAIPSDQYQYALECLENDREKVSYFGELKSTNLTQSTKIQLAKLWIKRMKHDKCKCFHFHILGLNMGNLQTRAFGDKHGEQQKRIYNRFFRSSVLYLLKYFFGDSPSIEVEAIFHDRTEMEYDDLFDWHTIWRIEREEDNITFASNIIEFVDSDHRKERHCLDCTSNKPGIIEAAKEISPLIERLANKRSCKNPNSRYCYYRRCSISFFPSRKLALEDLNDPLERLRSSFFVQRRLLLNEKLSGQQSLF
jgi:hypothetical protein